ncbi:MAG: L-seryl-tRNA(Sec) selenium transferase [Gemmatimonadetes bacterium]|nr:L-seryl-tRNA(Sec) selenium transferase [Gemmatimonadota bacterium]MDA1103629.1 L-seryl-tRNA(Sec) selenium transferase [Gemmatimonadota bacterium]
MNDPRSLIPSVDSLIASDGFKVLAETHGRGRVVEAARAAVEDVRAGIAEAVRLGVPGGWTDAVQDVDTYVHRARAWLESGDVPSLRTVINATGVVLHTNLGRAPLADAAVEAMRRAAAEYTNLEYDLASGVRGSRYSHCVSLLCELTGAPDALVVNNAAGALVLALNTLALGEGVAVSRGELVEIGGGFRIPEVLERSGARMVEVGSTNRTRPADYAEAVAESGVTVLLKVHRSNFSITGFTEEATLADLAALAAGSEVIVMHDLGSGLMVDPKSIGLPREPRATESLAAGADVVVVSGDKLLGGPQAGILVGRGDLMERMRKNPLCRALRVDKVTLAGLEATLRLYRDEDRARSQIPTLRMLSTDAKVLRDRADALQLRLEGVHVACEVVETRGAVGGGTFPSVELPSWAVAFRPEAGPDVLAQALRAGDPPVVGRIVDDALLLDVRTVLPGQDGDLVQRIRESLEAITAPS